LREIVNVSIANPSDYNEADKEEGSSYWTDEYTAYLLEGIPVFIKNVDSIPFHDYLSNRDSNPF